MNKNNQLVSSIKQITQYKYRLIQAIVVMIFFAIILNISLYTSRFSTNKNKSLDFDSVSTTSIIDFNKSFKNMSDNEFLGERYLKQLVSAIVFNNKNDKTLDTFIDCYVGCFIIPGMENTFECTEEVPQGLELVDDCILITAYCATQEHKPAIHIIDRDSGGYINTILLAEPSWHVGGICYNSSNDKIYITTYIDKVNKNSTVSVFNKSDILNPDDRQGETIIQYEDKDFSKKSNAFVTYNKYNNQVYLGGYKLNSFLTDTILNIDTLNDIEYTSFMQDMDFLEYNDKQYTIISRSVGSANSTLEFYEDTWETQDNLVNTTDSYELAGQAISTQEDTHKKNKVFTLSCPSFMEGIAIDEQQGLLLCTFESASTKYIKSTDIPFDRVMLLDLNKLMSYIQ